MAQHHPGGRDVRRYFQNMKVMLLDPNGQLGQDIICAHEEAGDPFDMVSLNRDQLDVANPEAVGHTLAGVDFDALINCTCRLRPDEVEDNATLAFDVNANSVKVMAKTCATKQARFIHFSTDLVFGGDLTCTEPLREDAPIAPINVYGASKAMGEALARLVCDDLIILRIATMFGPVGSSGNEENFIETIIRLAHEKNDIRIVDDQIMSPTWTTDVAQIVIRMLSDNCIPGLYNVVNSGQANWFDLAKEIILLTGSEATLIPCGNAGNPTRAARPNYSVLDNEKISALYGRLPIWQDTLERYLIAKGYFTNTNSPSESVEESSMTLSDRYFVMTIVDPINETMC
jgi:dTDP-4-dehydrorhamnose reductase